MIRPINLFRNAQSISLLLLLLLGFASISRAFGQQTQSQPGTSSKVPMSVARFYSHFLMHQSVLDATAAKLQSDGRDGNPLRNDLQTRLGFSDADYEPIRTSSQRLVLSLKAIDTHLNALQHTSANVEQAQALLAQRETLIYKEICNLALQLSPRNKATLEKFMVQFFAPKPLTFHASQLAVQPTRVTAQSSGSIDECSSHDYPYGIQGTACLIGNSTYLKAYEESGLLNAGVYAVVGQASEAKLYDGNTLLADSNAPDNPYSPCDYSYSQVSGSCGSVVVIESINIGHTYTVVGDIQVLFDPSWTGTYSDAYWIDEGGDTVSVQVGP